MEEKQKMNKVGPNKQSEKRNNANRTISHGNTNSNPSKHINKRNNRKGAEYYKSQKQQCGDYKIKAKAEQIDQNVKETVIRKSSPTEKQQHFGNIEENLREET